MLVGFDYHRATVQDTANTTQHNFPTTPAEYRDYLEMLLSSRRQSGRVLLYGVTRHLPRVIRHVIAVSPHRLLHYPAQRVPPPRGPPRAGRRRRQLHIAAAHGDEGATLRRPDELPQLEGSQVAARVQADRGELQGVCLRAGQRAQRLNGAEQGRRRQRRERREYTAAQSMKHKSIVPT